MSAHALFFTCFFALCSLAALVNPFWGLAAYAVHYHTSPEGTWWGGTLARMGVRYSLFISAFLACGTLLNLHKLPYGRLVSRQEKLFLIYLGWVVICQMAHGRETQEDAAEKMVKLGVFLLAMTHILVTPHRFRGFQWVLILCGTYVGWECYTAPRSMFVKGRLEGVGAADGTDSNMLAAHLVSLLPIAGVQLFRSSWSGKLICLVAGTLLFNGVVQTRSRGSYLALITTIIVMIALAPRGYRKLLCVLILLGGIVALTRIDAAYFDRMKTIQAGEREKDESAMSRLRFWKAGVAMAIDNPLGVGPGNFSTHIGEYLPQDAGRDTHNTYVRCLTELGWIGFALLIGIIGNSFLVLLQIRHKANATRASQDCVWMAYGLQMSLSAYTVASVFISATYIEIFWWLLLLPTALERSAQNALGGQSVRPA